MKPLEIKVVGHTPKTSVEICQEFLNTDRWSEFKGYSILPGIKNARFDVKNPNLVGSRINVQNTDGSSHVEEIVEWDINHHFTLKFHSFSAPVKNFATHFVETWAFRQTPTGTDTVRTMTMYPKGLLGWLILLPISRLMKRAFEENLRQTQDA